ncbi:MAG: ABC transporter ATP-binding protein [Gammaproteobacteria bacterium]|nr:ABC transporter ATP-binding protein [Gammaproteobacteria bacterium]
MPFLEIDQLSVAFDTEGDVVTVVDRVSFDVEAGETLGVVGESGCGKSVTALSIMGLLPKPAGRIQGGDIRFKGESLPSLAPERMRDIRGNRIAMIFQEPMTALNPVHRVGRQLAETYALHQGELSADVVHRRCLGLLEQVGIPAPEQRLSEYPHQLSGGMRQRVMIAMALASKPDILIADEPTTALDVTIQAQILELLRDLQRETGMAIIFITHDLGVIAELCSRVVVMYAGRMAEQAGIEPLFAHPVHPYTRGLLASIPRLEDTPKTMLTTIPGVVPSIEELPSGCRFANRCPYVKDLCSREAPELVAASPGHRVACHRWREVEAGTLEHWGS